MENVGGPSEEWDPTTPPLWGYMRAPLGLDSGCLVALPFGACSSLLVFVGVSTPTAQIWLSGPCSVMSLRLSTPNLSFSRWTSYTVLPVPDGMLLPSPFFRP